MSQWQRRVLLVEDDPFSVTLLTSILSQHGFEIRSCDSLVGARAEIRSFDPDLAILDVHLGGEASGLQVGYVLEQAHPAVAQMYLTRYPAAVLGDRRHRAHVRGKVVVDKDEVTDSSTLLNAIEAALRGHETDPPRLESGGVSRLTPTQLSVLGLIAEGWTNAAIAEHRGTTERAVEKLIEAIYATLGLEVRGERNARVLAALQYADVMGVTPSATSDSD